MAVRKLRVFEDEILKKKCRKVECVDERIRMQLQDMMDTLHETPNGAALAANQVGILKRLIVIDMEETKLMLVNPEIIEQEGSQECIEACLSFPGKAGKTIRPEKVVVRALNENGEELKLEGQGDLAKCFCHEIDHLDGIVFLDRAIQVVDVE